MQLTVLLRGGAGRDDAQLASREIESRTRQHLPVSVDDHPIVEMWVEPADVPAQTFVHLAVHDGARRFPLRPPILFGHRRAGGDRLRLPSPPLAHRVERPREPGEQVTLQYQFFDPYSRNIAKRGERVSRRALGAGRDDRREANQRARRRVEFEQDG